MAGETTTYSFADVNMVISHPAMGAYEMNGEGIGSVSVTMSTDKSVHDVAADGSVMVSKVAGDNAQIDVETQQTSSLHKWLLAYYNFILISSARFWATASITIIDKVSGETIEALEVSPLKKADKSYQAQGQRVTWQFLSANCQSVPF